LAVGGSGGDVVDILGKVVTIAATIGRGTTNGTIALSDGAVLHLADIASSQWTARAQGDGHGGTQITVGPGGAVDDFNGDAKSDILWSNPNSGDTWVWLMDGVQQLANVNVGQGGAGYKIVGTGDFNN